jgi:hypothetical protein
MSRQSTIFVRTAILMERIQLPVAEERLVTHGYAPAAISCGPKLPFKSIVPMFALPTLTLFGVNGPYADVCSSDVNALWC